MFKAIRQFFSDVKEAGRDLLEFGGKITEAAAEEIVRCHAKTRRGERCRRYAVELNGYCRQHQNYEPDPTENQCRARTSRDTRCSKRALSGERFCWLHGGSRLPVQRTAPNDITPEVVRWISKVMEN